MIIWDEDESPHFDVVGAIRFLMQSKLDAWTCTEWVYEMNQWQKWFDERHHRELSFDFPSNVWKKAWEWFFPESKKFFVVDMSFSANADYTEDVECIKRYAEGKKTNDYSGRLGALLAFYRICKRKLPEIVSSDILRLMDRELDGEKKWQEPPTKPPECLLGKVPNHELPSTYSGWVHVVVPPKETGAGDDWGDAAVAETGVTGADDWGDVPDIYDIPLSVMS